MTSQRVVSQPLSHNSLSCFEKGKRENSGNEVAVFFVCLFAFQYGSLPSMAYGTGCVFAIMLD